MTLCEGIDSGVPQATCDTEMMVDGCRAADCFWFENECVAKADITVQYNDEVPTKLDRWVDALDAWKPGAGLDQFRFCDVVFNYSENGNVLDAVVSLKNKLSFVTVDNRAVEVAAWK